MPDACIVPLMQGMKPLRSGLTFLLEEATDLFAFLAALRQDWLGIDVIFNEGVVSDIVEIR